MTRSPRPSSSPPGELGRRGRTGTDTAHDTGIAAVEFALVVPLLLALLVGVVIAGTAAVGQLKVQAAARDGARAASVDPGVGCTVALDRLIGTSSTVGAPSCTATAVCPGTDSTISVTATRTVTIPIIGDRTITLNADSTYECQRSGQTHDHHS